MVEPRKRAALKRDLLNAMEETSTSEKSVLQSQVSDEMKSMRLAIESLRANTIPTNPTSNIALPLPEIPEKAVGDSSEQSQARTMRNMWWRVPTINQSFLEGVGIGAISMGLMAIIISHR